MSLLLELISWFDADSCHGNASDLTVVLLRFCNDSSLRLDGAWSTERPIGIECYLLKAFTVIILNFFCSCVAPTATLCQL